jgi:hypothetical protein
MEIASRSGAITKEGEKERTKKAEEGDLDFLSRFCWVDTSRERFPH